MGDRTGIEWADATWNPIVGCSLASPGCTNCYAMRAAARLGANPATPHYAGLTRGARAQAVWTGAFALAPRRVLEQPLRWTRPRQVFVNSMGDLFHPDIPPDWLAVVLAVMDRAPQHRYLALTKRPAEMRRRLIGEYGRAGLHRRPYLWLGASAEDQRRLEERGPALVATPAAARFLSLEPLLGPLDLPAVFGWTLPGIDWVIAGGESGPRARPSSAAWYRKIRDDCARAGVPFFFKQWGEFAPIGAGEAPVRVGKKAAGALLDGREHREVPL